MNKMKKKRPLIALIIASIMLISVFYYIPNARASTIVYRGMNVFPNDFTIGTEMANYASQGGNFINFENLQYGTYLPNPVTSPSQISSSVFATMDTWASWAQANKIYCCISFNSIDYYPLSDNPSWIQALDGGNGYLIEQDYFFDNIATVGTLITSINCLWQAIAARYASNPYMIFDFFCEPMNTANYGSGNWRNTLIDTTYSGQQWNSAYATTIAGLANTVRSVSGNSNRIIIVDMPWSSFDECHAGSTATTTDIPNTYLNYASNPLIWSFHNYVTPSMSLTEWEEYINWAVYNYVTTFGKPLIIGEYGILDANGIAAPDFTDPATGASWKTDLSSMVAYLNTLPIVGYSWFCHGFLYGEYANTYNALDGYTVYSSTDSTFILATVFSGSPSPTPTAGAPTSNPSISSVKVTNIVLDPSYTMSGQSFVESGFVLPVNVTVQNSVSVSEVANVQLFANSTSIFNGALSVDSLASGILDCSVDTESLPIGYYTISASVTPLDEPNATPSTMTAGTVGVTYLGDLNGEFKVNFDDMIIFVGDYIAYWTNGAYNPAADFNHNGQIDFDDLRTFRGAYQNYEETLST